ncbi:MAG TPA: hypothetical protein VF719_06445 [Abditibacteriaceae bacterium]
MNKVQCFFGVCIILLGIALSAGVRAQDSQQASDHQPRRYELQLILIADAPTMEYLRIIKLQGDQSAPYSGYKSLGAPGLRNWVKERVSDGSVIEYSPGCLRTGGEPGGKELDDFRAFCKAEGVKFIIHPSG